MPDPRYVLYHRLADPASAAIRAKIVEVGLIARLHEGSYAVRLALGAIIAAEEQKR